MERTQDAEETEPPERNLARGAALANVGGALGNVWATYGAPNSLLLLLFVSEWLHGEKWHVGLILALNNLGPTLEPLGAWLMERLGRRKALFLATHLCQRIPFLIFALIPLLPPSAANLQLGLTLVFIVVAVTRIAGHLGSAAWWSWMGDLVPAERRSHWLGSRFQCASGVMAVSFLAASQLLHHCGGLHNCVLVSGLFAIGATFGVADILIYCWVPELPMRTHRPCRSWRDFLGRAGQPYRQPAFCRFLLCLGVWLFGVNLVVPFVPLYLKGEWVAGEYVGLGVSWTYLAAFQVLAQVGTMLSSRWWGRWCPRLGPRHLLHVGAGHLFVQLSLLLVGQHHYHLCLLTTSLLGGILLGAWQVGSQQMLFELAPIKNRGFYTSAYNTTSGWGIAAGSFLGGMLADRFSTAAWRLPSGLPIAYLHIQLVVGASIGCCALWLLARVSAERPIHPRPWQRMAKRLTLPPRLAWKRWEAIRNVALGTRQSRHTIIGDSPLRTQEPARVPSCPSH